MKKSAYVIFVFFALFCVFSAIFALSLFFGSAPDDTEKINVIIYRIRLPRTIAAAVSGGALSVSGYLLQTFFNNPIAGPFVLGISSGAKMTVAFAMIAALSAGTALNSFMLILAAFFGSMLSMGAVLLFSGKIKSSPSLIVAGVMIGYICSAVTDFAVTFADDGNIVNLHNWSMGSFSGIDNSDAAVIAAAVFPAVIISFVLSKQIGAYRLGETYAKSMGLDIKLFRLMLILLSSFLSAVVTAFAGPVSFVGIAVPHLVKGLFKTSEPKIIIPAAFLGGAVFCLFCDFTARTVFSPAELSVGTVTAVFGAPAVIAVMLRKKERK